MNCHSSKISLHTQSTQKRELLGTYCGTLPKFYIYSHNNTIILSFTKQNTQDIVIIEGLFQVIDKNSLQTAPQKWGKNNYQNAFRQIDTHFSVYPFSNFDMPIFTYGKFLDVFEWIFFAPPGNTVTTKVKINCLENVGIEVLLLHGFSYSGHLSNKYTCMTNEQQNHHGIQKTFLVTMSAVVTSEAAITKRNSIIEGSFTSVKFLKGKTEADIKVVEIPVHEIPHNVLVFGNESYQVFHFFTTARSYLKLEIKQQSPIKYTLHLCATLGIYILEEIRNETFIYGPYCNLSVFDALNGNTFLFYSHEESLKIITYHFNFDLEPVFKMRLKVSKNNCQGIANVCLLFSKLTPIR